MKIKNIRNTGEYGKIWTNTGKCVFCELNPKYIIYTENNVSLSVNLFPYCDGHLLIIPHKHVSSPKELSVKEWNSVRKLIYLSKKIIKKRFKTKDIWTLIREGGTGSQMSVLGHLHIHCIPIFSSDFVKWNYQDLSIDPKILAAELKSLSSELKNLSAKFDKKYGE